MDQGHPPIAGNNNDPRMMTPSPTRFVNSPSPQMATGANGQLANSFSQMSIQQQPGRMAHSNSMTSMYPRPPSTPQQLLQNLNPSASTGTVNGPSVLFQQRPGHVTYPPATPPSFHPIGGAVGHGAVNGGFVQPPAYQASASATAGLPTSASHLQFPVNQQQQPARMVKNIQLIGVQPGTERLDEVKESTLNVQLQHPQHEPVVAGAPHVECTHDFIPKDFALLQKTKIPIGMTLTPFREPSSENIVPVLGASDRQNPAQPVYPSPSICRCSRCRAYLNPYVMFVDQTHWRCSFCYLVNTLPGYFDFDLQTQQYSDRFQRPELKYATVDYVAPSDYMVRPPQPPVFVFVVDVSQAAVQQGVVQAFSKAMLNALDDITNELDRTRVAFVCYDTCVRFIKFDVDTQMFTELVVSDVDDVFLPSSDDLLVSLTDCKAILIDFLEKMPVLYSRSTYGNALGAALQGSFQLISGMGGKLITVNASLISHGPGALPNRLDPKAQNTPNENKLLQSQNAFFKTYAIDCSRAQITVDLFLLGHQYMDLATLTGACRYTGGTEFYYPGFGAADFEKLAVDLSYLLSMEIGLEAVLRVRATRGVRIEAYHGNFFIRSTDLLAIPSATHDNTYTLQLTVEEAVQTDRVCFQSALLHTTAYGERRIRVSTICLPCTSDLNTLYAGLNQRALISLLAKMAVERALTAKLEDAREAVVNKLCDIITAWRTIQGQSAVAGVCVPDTLDLFPVLCLALLKNPVLGLCDTVDRRCALIDSIRAVGVEQITRILYPRLYEIHSIRGDIGTIKAPTQEQPTTERSQEELIKLVVMPATINLTSEKFIRQGVYLLDAETDLYLWISRAAPPQLLIDLLEKPYEIIQSGKTSIPILQTAINVRLRNIISRCRSRRWPQVTIVKEEGDPLLRSIFLNLLVEDKTVSGSSYVSFLSEIRDKCASK